MSRFFILPFFVSPLVCPTTGGGAVSTAEATVAPYESLLGAYDFGELSALGMRVVDFADLPRAVRFRGPGCETARA